MEFRTWQLRTVSIHCTEKLLMPAARGWRTLRDKYALAPRDESGELTKGDTSSQFEPYRFIQMSATAWWKIWFSFTLQESCMIWDSPMGLFLFIFHQDPFPGYQSACKMPLDKDGEKMAEQTDLELQNNWEGCNLTLRGENLVMKQCSTAVQACVKVMPGFKFPFLCWNT